MKRKSIKGLKITDHDQGKVEVVFATLNAKDADGDVTAEGAFEDGAAVRISAYNHTSWGSALPVGKGTISVRGADAIMEGEFFLETETGREHFEVVKQMGDLQEWSYGYDVEDSASGTHDGEAVNVLKKLKVHEVSPVILGAGVNTRTLAVKGKQLGSDVAARLRAAGRERWGDDDTWVYVDDFDIDDSWAVFHVNPEDEAVRYLRVSFSRDDDGNVALADEETEVQPSTEYTPKRLTDQLTEVMAQVKQVTDRVADVVAKRAEKGKGLGAASSEAATELESACKRLKELLQDDPEEPEESETGGEEPPDDDSLATDALDIEADLAEAATRLRI